MKQIGLFFGSFNPIHIGHLALANYMCEFENMDEVWLVVSPQNPFKKSVDLIETDQRIKMVELATENYANMRVETIETTLPTPSYTINTLEALQKQYKDCFFNIIMGADNIQNIHRWKDSDMILSNYCIYVYPRLGYSTDGIELPLSCKITQAPIIEISSTQVRQWLKAGKTIPYFTPEKVISYVKENKLYQ
ncbi:nicotinate (nicotinamide) nucleotide adenylyltransferase [Carboxylicivirga sp. N1Y90]|uniref:nicotinate (nicotinamide) nucleotide adenylyltransferase n=1 Tax=Carboxylicivirga fragile TaxID=3417571 RepID=UPI003D3315F1|nr:nicotinate-nucleotide adenylyltransferase [Marinilabiliaceae bacterium N1Y90]